MSGARSRFSSLSRALFNRPIQESIDSQVEKRARNRIVEQVIATRTSIRVKPFSASTNDLPLESIPFQPDLPQGAQVGLQDEGKAFLFRAGPKAAGQGPEVDCVFARKGSLPVKGPGLGGTVVGRHQSDRENSAGHYNFDECQSGLPSETLTGKMASASELTTAFDPCGFHSLDHLARPETAMRMRRVPASLVILKLPAGAAVPRPWKVMDLAGTLAK